MQRCSEWMKRLGAAGGAARLAAIYGDVPSLLENRRAAILTAVRRFSDAFGDQRVTIYRVPARISLNPHSDHQGAWVPYGTHARELIAVCAPADGGQFEIVNTDPAVASPLYFDLGEEIAVAPEAWKEGW